MQWDYWESAEGHKQKIISALAKAPRHLSNHAKANVNGLNRDNLGILEWVGLKD